MAGAISDPNLTAQEKLAGLLAAIGQGMAPLMGGLTPGEQALVDQYGERNKLPPEAMRRLIPPGQQSFGPM